MIVLPVIFYKWFIITYVNKGGNIGILRVHKYFKDIDYLSPYNEEFTITESSTTEYRRYSFVLFDEDFGIVFKQYNSNTFYRYQLSTMSMNGYATFNGNGLVDTTVNKLVDLVMIQRR